MSEKYFYIVSEWKLKKNLKDFINLFDLSLTEVFHKLGNHILKFRYLLIQNCPCILIKQFNEVIKSVEKLRVLLIPILSINLYKVIDTQQLSMLRKYTVNILSQTEPELV